MTKKICSHLFSLAICLIFALGFLLPSYLLGAIHTQPTVKITWLGHAAFLIEIDSKEVILIDPWINNPLNPATQGNKDATEAIKKADFMLITHGHFDHVGDAKALCKKTKAKIITNFELGTQMSRSLDLDSECIRMDYLMNIGGAVTLIPNKVTVIMTQALHSSGFDPLAFPQSKTENAKGAGNDSEGEQKKSQSPMSNAILYGGEAASFIIDIQDGPRIFHSGDTAYFSDFKTIGEQYHPTIALMNAGGHFGISQKLAARACQELKTQYVVPHHYKTFPLLMQNIDELKSALPKNIKLLDMKPGSSILFQGKKFISSTP